MHGFRISSGLYFDATTMTSKHSISGSGVVLIGRPGESTSVIAAALQKRFPDMAIVLERVPGFRQQLGVRFRRMGVRRAFGQLLFRGLSPLFILLRARRRRELLAALRKEHPGVVMPRATIGSINSKSTRDLLKSLQPRVVVVNGTRIIGRKTLSCAPLFLNMHAGITPEYRGVHGGYWAMASGDPRNFGVTIHVVDQGVDTGRIITQVRVIPDRKDGFYTYPLVQLATGIEQLVNVVEAASSGRLPATRAVTDARQGMSRQWYHPTLLEYLANGLRRGVW